MKNNLNNEALLKITDGLFTSKIRYGLQLMGSVRRNVEDPLNADLMAIQKIQNKLVRFLNKSKISDRINTSTLLTNLNMLSINQMNAQAKLVEMWKVTNTKNHPNSFQRQEPIEGSSVTRGCSKRRLIETGSNTLTLKTFKSDAARLWNSAPDSITKCETINQVKKAVKIYVKSLPI